MMSKFDKVVKPGRGQTSLTHILKRHLQEKIPIVFFWGEQKSVDVVTAGQIRIQVL